VAVTAGAAAGQSSGKQALTASEVGITATEIRIGVIADTGSPLAPGLFQGAVDGVKAWASYMNAKEGGLAGRKIVVDSYDSSLNADKSRNSIIEACGKDFALVGTSALFVNNVDDLVSCPDTKGAATGLPDFPVVTTEAVHQCSPVSFGVNPPSLVCATKDQSPQTYHGNLFATRYFLKKYGKSALHGLYLFPSDLKSAKNSEVPAATAHQRLGIKQDATFDASGRAPQSTYTPFVQAMKDHGSTYAFDGLNDASVIALRKEAKIQGLTTVKVWDCGAQCYDKDLISSANAADMEGQYVTINFLPFEEAKTNKMLANFLKYIGRDKADGFSLQAFSSGLVLRDAVNNIVTSGNKNDVTRKAVLAELPKITKFTADGMMGAVNVGQHVPSTCYVLMQVHNAKFVRIFPKKKGTIECKPNNLFTIKLDLK